jgi:amino acid permease
MIMVRCWHAGAVGCFLLCIVLGACEAFTLYVLSKFSERYQARTYSGLVRRALGRKLSASECCMRAACGTVEC